MAKKFNFDKKMENDANNVIEEILQADFPLPEQAEAAKNEAFAKIREMAAISERQESTKDTYSEENRKVESLEINKYSQNDREFVDNSNSTQSHRKFKTVYKTALGMTAAAAVFSAVCITNPAFAENIPLVGNVFERIGNSLGFSGDFSKYATPLEDENSSTEVGSTQNEKEQNTSSDNMNTNATESDNKENENTDSKWSQTYNGTTLTVSEVYCNDSALYVSLVISMEDKIPDTMLTEDGTPHISLDCGEGPVELECSFNEGKQWTDGYIDGKLVDDHTFAGVLRIDTHDFTYDNAGSEKYYEARNKFWKEKGIDIMEASPEEMSEAVGVDDIYNMTDEEMREAGMPVEQDYLKEIKIPDEFTLELKASKIIGDLPEEQVTTPEIPQELRDERAQAVADAGLNEDDYENFTEEQQEKLRLIDQKMYNKYTKLYPDVNKHPNKYENWWVDGDWDFTIPVEKNDAQTVTKEIQAVDSEGNGVTSLTKTPFEITMNESGDTADYFPVILDADGKPMSFGKFTGTANTVAISDRDISTVYVYLCDYIEYMDELKGCYWSDDYEEKAKTKTFKQLLDERAVASAEVHFDENK